MFHLHRSSRLMHSVRVSSAFAVAHMYFSHVQASASINAIPESHVFDLIVIGGGSGGVACARRAASYGKKVELPSLRMPAKDLMTLIKDIFHIALVQH